MGWRQLERVLVGATGVAFIALAVLVVELLPGAAGWVIGVPLGAVGGAVLWATVVRWSPEAASSGRRESPELLLPVERLFLLPVVALAAAGLVAILRDPDLNPGIRLALLGSTALILVLIGGFAAGLIRLPPPYPHRRGREDPLRGSGAASGRPGAPGGGGGGRGRKARARAQRRGL